MPAPPPHQRRSYVEKILILERGLKHERPSPVGRRSLSTVEKRLILERGLKRKTCRGDRPVAPTQEALRALVRSSGARIFLRRRRLFGVTSRSSSSSRKSKLCSRLRTLLFGKCPPRLYGAGDGIRTRDNLLGRYLALSGVAKRLLNLMGSSESCPVMV